MMNNEELIATAVRESVSGVHMTIPEEQIVSRSRTIRARRRIPAAAGALAVAGGAALAVTALAPSGHQPGHPVSARLAAWTVTRQASGNIDVTINQLKNPAGLQTRLRADGLSVNVSFSGAPLSASCKPYNNVSKTVLSAVVQLSSGGKSTHFVIDPSALPTGAGLAIYDNPGGGAPPPSPSAQGTGNPPPAGLTGPLAFGLVHSSQQCTG
jgi:hypothetical protein